MRTLLLALLPLPALAEVSVTDAAGATISLPAPAGRVVCLSSACTQDLAVLGVLPVAVGPEDNISVARDPAAFGERAEGIAVLPWVDGYDAEAIAALRPDLIVGWLGIEEWLAPEALAGVAPLLAPPEPMDATDLDGLLGSLRMLAALTGREAEAEAFARRLTDRLAAYARLAPAERARVAVVRLGLPDQPGVLLPPDCGVALGLVAECASATGAWQEMSVEGLLALDPDVIVAEDWGGSTGDPAAYADVPLWPEVRAVAEGRVHYVPAGRTLDYSALAAALSLDALVPLLYPATFPAPLTDAAVAAAIAQE